MKTIKLTRVQVGTVVDKDTVRTVTKQSVAGSGSRNIIPWALSSSRQGYKNLQILAPDATTESASNSVDKGVFEANQSLNHFGVYIVRV